MPFDLMPSIKELNQIHYVESYSMIFAPPYFTDFVVNWVLYFMLGGRRTKFFQNVLADPY